MVEISILDYAQMDEGITPTEAVKNSVELAQLAEKLGYKRFWVAEHHSVPAFGSVSPELMMMHIADRTDHIHIGSGGIMYPHYSPFKIAENIRQLQAVHPGRIDIGLGNSPGTPLIDAALNEKKESTYSFEETIPDLKHYLTDDQQDSFRHQNLKVMPYTNEIPEIWSLSISEKSAIKAGREGLGFCFGFFPYAVLSFKQAVRTIERYRKEFKPSSVFDKPKVMFSFFAAIGETEEEAEAIAKSIDLWMLGQNNFTQFSRIPSVKTAREYELSDEEKERVTENRHRLIVGTPQSVKQQLDDFTEALDADEVLLCTIMPDIENRKKGITLLAKEFGMN